MRTHTESRLLQLTLFIVANAHVLNIYSEPSSTAPTAAPTAPLKYDPSCFVLGEALAICASLTSHFTDINPTAQAECLCYSSTVWAPTFFDLAVESCVVFASVSATYAFSALANIQGFCGSIGNVLKSPGTIPAFTTTTPPILSACAGMNSIVASCNALTPGLSTMDEIAQAGCLCYPTLGTWAPTIFDNAVDDCSHDVTANSTYFSPATSFQGFCSRVGDVASGVSASTTHQANSTLASSTFSSASATPSNSANISEIWVIPIPVPSTPLTPPATPTATISTFRITTYDTSTPSHGIATVTSSTPMPTSTAEAAEAPATSPKIEVIIVSLCCATVMLFLC